MSAKLSLLVLKTSESYSLVYHRDLKDPVNESATHLWSHPSIMASHKFTWGPNKDPYDLNVLLDGHYGKWAETTSSKMHYPHVRLEVTNAKVGDPLHRSIPEETFLSDLVFRYDNPSGFVRAGADLPKEFKDDPHLETAIKKNLFPLQPWALKWMRSIHRRVIGDLVAMRAGTWTNPPVLFEDLAPFVHPQDRYLTVPAGEKVRSVGNIDNINILADIWLPWRNLADGSAIRSINRSASGTDDALRKIARGNPRGQYLIELFVDPTRTEFAAYVQTVYSYDSSSRQLFVSKGFASKMLKEAGYINVKDYNIVDIRRILRENPDNATVCDLPKVLMTGLDSPVLATI